MLIYALVAVLLSMMILRMGQAPVRAQADADQASIKGIDLSATTF